MSRLHHIQIVVGPGKTSEVLDFYSLLGLGRLDKPVAEGIQQEGAWFVTSDGGQVHISERPEVPESGDRHFGLVVDEYDAVLAGLRAAGHKVQERPSVLGTRRCFAYDPEDNAVELIEPVGLFSAV